MSICKKYLCYIQHSLSSLQRSNPYSPEQRAAKLWLVAGWYFRAEEAP